MSYTEQEIEKALDLADKSYDHVHIYPQHKEVTVLAAAESVAGTGEK